MTMFMPAHQPAASQPSQTIVLASQSPRRRQLLEWAEIDFEVVIRPTRETWPDGMPVVEVPVHIARSKAIRVQEELPDRLIIAADTVVVLDGRVIGKPTDTHDAQVILQALSGRTHRVITGVVIRSADQEETITEITEVTFHPLTAEQIAFYIDKYQPFDKAGAYGIQEWIGVIGISGITGDFYNVMGLPVSRVVQTLARMKR